MATFSISGAVGSGFGIIRRKPLVVLAWGLTYLVLGFGPVLAVFALLGPGFVDLLREPMAMAARGERPTFVSPGFMQLQARMMAVQPLAVLGTLAGRAVLTSAIFRAVLEPGDSAFAYLRLGLRELWLGLLILAMSILLVILMIALVIPTAIVASIAGVVLAQSHVQQGWIGLVVFIAVLAWLAVFVWICLRFCMAAPMTFAQREFRLFESWALTKGQSGKLFVLGFVLTILVMAIGLVVEAVLALCALTAVGLSILHPDQIGAFFHQPVQTWMQTLMPWAAVALLVFSFFAAAMTTIFVAPWAAVYQRLTGGDVAPVPAAET